MFTIQNGLYAVVSPQNWLFLGSDTMLRKRMLNKQTWQTVVKLGPKAFVTPMWDFNLALFVFQNSLPQPKSCFLGLDAMETPSPLYKAEAICKMEGMLVQQEAQMHNPDHRVVIGETLDGPLLSEYAESYQGISPADAPQFSRCFWEVTLDHSTWVGWQSTVETTMNYGGRDLVLLWESGLGSLAAKVRSGDAYIRGQEAWGKQGIVVSQMGELPVTIYSGDRFDTNCAVIIPRDKNYTKAIWCFCKSTEFRKSVRQIDQALKVTNSSLVKVPFDLKRWQQIAEQEYPSSLPDPCSNDATQWLFIGNIPGSENPLQTAVGDLSGYKWPEEPSEDGLKDFVDVDGILCIPALLGERPAVDRLRDLLKAAYGSDWNLSLEESLLDQAGYKDKGLEVWLRDGFFEQHCKLFHHRPFIWHIWDGIRDGSGFSALVNYHKLDRANLEKLTYAHLGEWIRRQSEAINNDEPGAEKRLIAAENLQKKLSLILEGEPPYDIYIRWKQLHEQPIGWEPDLNDGVRLNIRPFMNADILRWRPNINWNKDRGKNPDGSERINDVNLTIKEKRDAKGRIMICATAKPI
jgi:hypothetical protein